MKIYSILFLLCLLVGCVSYRQEDHDSCGRWEYLKFFPGFNGYNSGIQARTCSVQKVVIEDDDFLGTERIISSVGGGYRNTARLEFYNSGLKKVTFMVFATKEQEAVFSDQNQPGVYEITLYPKQKTIVNLDRFNRDMKDPAVYMSLISMIEH